MNFDHLIMGFPLAKGWGVAIGIVPYSNGYYKLTESVHEDTDPDYDPLDRRIQLHIMPVMEELQVFSWVQALI